MKIPDKVEKVNFGQIGPPPTLRHLISVMRRHDLSKKDNDKDIQKTPSKNDLRDL